MPAWDYPGDLLGEPVGTVSWQVHGGLAETGGSGGGAEVGSPTRPGRGRRTRPQVPDVIDAARLGGAQPVAPDVHAPRLIPSGPPGRSAITLPTSGAARSLPHCLRDHEPQVPGARLCAGAPVCQVQYPVTSRARFFNTIPRSGPVRVRPARQRTRLSASRLCSAALAVPGNRLCSRSPRRRDGAVVAGPVVPGRRRPARS